MEKKKVVVRIVAAGLATLMLLGVLVSAITALAAEATDTDLMFTTTIAPDTGGDIPKWPIAIAVVAVVLVVGCIVVPKLLKKGGKDEGANDTDADDQA